MEINSYEGYSRKMVRTIGIAAKPHLHASVWFHKTISTNDKSAICYSGQIPLGLTHMQENHHMHRWSTINKPDQLFFLCVFSLSLNRRFVGSYFTGQTPTTHKRMPDDVEIDVCSSNKMLLNKINSDRILWNNYLLYIAPYFNVDVRENIYSEYSVKVNKTLGSVRTHNLKMKYLFHSFWPL